MKQISCCLLLSVLLVPCGVAASAEPDQVLVLYNKDWTGDLPGTRKGQDSEEVALYYVQRHTDPATGKKPYLLGLTCKHTPQNSHLNHDRIEEASRDNYFGVIYKGRGRPLSADEAKRQQYMLSPGVICVVTPKTVDWNSVTLAAGPTDRREQATAYYSNGASARQNGSDLVEVKDLTDPVRRELRFNALRAGLGGDVYVWFSARDASGKVVLDDLARYFSPDDLTFTRTGPDGIRDDRNYMEDIEQPVKAFLEDPANAVGGQPLRDHILYIVVCYGLPPAVCRVYGLGQGVKATTGEDAGRLVSLCQRLEMMYYDVEAVRPPGLMAGRFEERYRSFQIFAPLPNYWVPFAGWRDQPYLHPDAYQGTKDPTLLKRGQDPPHFTSQLRKSIPNRFLYLASCLDGPSPRLACNLVDSAQYASRYFTPFIGRPPQGDWDGAKALAGTENKWGREELKALAGITRPNVPNEPLLPFGRRSDGVYYPGIVDWVVISANALNNPKSDVLTELRAGVTATGGAARAGFGCPHTTTHAWWDERIFFHYFYRGYELGEAWLYSRFTLQWCTSLFGDPLFRCDLRTTRFDTTPPQLAGSGDIDVTVLRTGGKLRAILDVRLQTTPGNPETALAEVEYWKQGEEAGRRRAADTVFAGRPQVVLDNLDDQAVYHYRLTLTDPYGNTFDSQKAIGDLSFRAEAGPRP